MNVKNGNLLVYKNGRWLMGSGGGISVTEIESPEEITADSPDGLYIQEGGTSTPSGGTTIHYYDSLDSVPADLPEGSFVAVPSEGNTKVIGLTQYAFDGDDAGTFNDAIVLLFSQGGGQIELPTSNNTFWSDLNTVKEIMFLFDGSALTQGMQLESRAEGIVKLNGLPVSASFVILVNTGIVARATIIFENTFDTASQINTSTKIMVTVETLNAPTT